jgi:pyruvate,orthophosphate dikinase
MLQTRNAKRSPVAAVKVAVDMVVEGLLTKEEAVMRVTPTQLDTLLHPQVDPQAKVQVIARAIPASPGAGYGKVIFESKKAAELGEAGEKVVLVRQDTSPEDIDGISKAQATLTTRGGASAHAALVARGLGKPCVVGADQIKLNGVEKTFVANGVTVHEGDVITVNGTTGEVILGQAPMVDAEQTAELATLLGYADGIRRLGVRANADTPANAHKARAFGAEGIGLCRTERMFNDPERLPLMQEMVIAGSLEERTPALEKLLPMQRDDFEKILEAMDGFPVIIRLLDPPLHEFLPQIDRLTEEMAEAETAHDEARIAYLQKVMKRYNELKEFNPMIGFRGCRVGIVYPDIYQLQVRAIAEATATLVKRGLHPMPEIMLPLVGHVNEIKVLKPLVQEELDKVFKREGITVAVKIGTMVEVPRACLTADEIAEYAEFFSFGTNDLTQTTYAYSRDDAAGTFLPAYLESKILDVDPFQTIDRKGVGKLIRIAVVLGRQTNPGLEIGICGEQGGEADSIDFCHTSGLDYVSCSAPRVPIARLAAAQAAIKNRPAAS